jgi:glycosyltransferase involved in cell wall biosynthesis
MAVYSSSSSSSNSSSSMSRGALMQATKRRVYPLITVGIVVFNREWIIEKMHRSLQSQTYPHDRLFVVVVDGGSKDNTVRVMNDFLAKIDFFGYEVIVEKTNIPEARNLYQKDARRFYFFLG